MLLNYLILSNDITPNHVLKMIEHWCFTYLVMVCNDTRNTIMCKWQNYDVFMPNMQIYKVMLVIVSNVRIRRI